MQSWDLRQGPNAKTAQHITPLDPKKLELKPGRGATMKEAVAELFLKVHEHTRTYIKSGVPTRLDPSEYSVATGWSYHNSAGLPMMINARNAKKHGSLYTQMNDKNVRATLRAATGDPSSKVNHKYDYQWSMSVCGYLDYIETDKAKKQSLLVTEPETGQRRLMQMICTKHVEAMGLGEKQDFITKSKYFEKIILGKGADSPKAKSKTVKLVKPKAIFHSNNFNRHFIYNQYKLNT